MIRTAQLTQIGGLQLPTMPMQSSTVPAQTSGDWTTVITNMMPMMMTMIMMVMMMKQMGKVM